MQHYIITNRKINDGKIDFNKNIAGVEFRVASAGWGADLEEEIKTTALAEVDGKFERWKSKIGVSVMPEGNNAGTDYALDTVEELVGQGGSATFFGELYKFMYDEGRGKKKILVFVHGFANGEKDFYCNLVKLHKNFVQEKGTIDRIIMVLWPTNGSLVLQYWDDQNDAELTGAMLGRVFQKLLKFIDDFIRPADPDETKRKQLCNSKLYLMCHSMGNQVLYWFMNEIEKKEAFRAMPIFSDILLVAADVRADALEKGERLYELPQLGNRIQVYCNRNDHALDISKVTKNLKLRLGKRGPVNMASVPQNVIVVDVTKSVNNQTGSRIDDMINHWYHLDAEVVIKDIQLVLKGMNNPKRKYDPQEQKYVLPERG